MGQRRVVFGRVNQRYHGSIDQLSFHDQMLLVSELGHFEAYQGGKRWIVGNIAIDKTTSFLSGIIGFADLEVRLHVDEVSGSWLKASSQLVDGASSQAVVPFAIDLRPNRRWTASVTSPRIRPETFCRGFELSINRARSRLGLDMSLEVDVVTSRTTVEEWVEMHPEIRVIRRVVKLPNPRRDIAQDIQDMEDLAASRKEEQYTAGRNQNLRAVDDAGRASNAIRNLTVGLDTGQVEITMEARGPGGGSRFRSVTSPDETRIPDFMDDWQHGIELVLYALRDYSDRRAE